MKTQDYSDKKVWVYYRRNTPIKHIYAFTTSKKIAKEFEKQRNMKIFIKEKTYLDELEEEHENFLFSHKINELQWYPLYDGVEDVMVISNQLEMDIINGKISSIEDDANELKRHLHSDCCIFNEKTKKTLLELLKVYITNKDGDLISNINSFHIFIQNFEDTLKK